MAARGGGAGAGEGGERARERRVGFVQVGPSRGEGRGSFFFPLSLLDFSLFIYGEEYL